MLESPRWYHAKQSVACALVMLAAACGGGGGGSGGEVGAFVYAYGWGVESCVVSGYAVDGQTGALRALEAGTVSIPADVRANCWLLVAAPSGRFLYAILAYAGRSLLAGYAVDARTGALTTVPGDPIDVAASWAPGLPLKTATPLAMTMAPGGRHLYVVTGDSLAGRHIDAYAVAADGKLTFLRRTDFSNIYTSKVEAFFSPDGDRFFIGSPSGLTMFRVDPTSGELEELGTRELTAEGGSPIAFALDSTGRRLFVGFEVRPADPCTSYVRAYGVEDDGSLAAPSGPLLDTGGYCLQTLRVGPGDDVLYFGGEYGLNYSGVRAYTIGTSGDLAPVDGSQELHASAYDLALLPSGRALYAAPVQAGFVSAATVSPETGALGGELPGSPFLAGGSVTKLVVLTPAR